MPNSPESITSAIIKAVLRSSASSGQLRGFLTALLGILLLSVTYIVPEDFEKYVQWTCMFVIAVGVGVLLWSSISRGKGR